LNFYIFVIFSLNILIAAIIGGVRYKHVHHNYYPLLYFFWLGGVNEILGILLMMAGVNIAVNGNIYILLEGTLITWYFKQIGLFKRVPALFYCILTAFGVAWVFENFVFRSITQVDIYFRIFYSFIIVLMSIHAINNIIISSKKGLLKNASFLVCIGFIAYYTYKVIVEAFWIYGLSSSLQFQMVIFDILIYINVVVNFIYALAALWMPKRQAFTLPS
jgi:hypothetical protein